MTNGDRKIYEINYRVESKEDFKNLMNFFCRKRVFSKKVDDEYEAIFLENISLIKTLTPNK